MKQTDNINPYKITFLGDTSVGKSCISMRLTKNEYRDNLESTIGAAFKAFVLNDIHYNIWDTAGQERYYSLGEMYYRNSDFIVLVFEINNQKSIDKLKNYISDIRKKIINDYRIIIIGNKIDKSTNQLNDILYAEKQIREIFEKNIYVSPDDPKYPEILFVSAKENTNIDKLIDIIKRKTPGINRNKITTNSDSETIKLDKTNYFNLNYEKCTC